MIKRAGLDIFLGKCQYLLGVKWVKSEFVCKNLGTNVDNMDVKWKTWTQIPFWEQFIFTYFWNWYAVTMVDHGLATCRRQFFLYFQNDCTRACLERYFKPSVWVLPDGTVISALWKWKNGQAKIFSLGNANICLGWNGSKVNLFVKI